MQEAGLMNFLRTIFIIILIYYGLKIIARFAFPLLFKKVMGNVEKKFRDQQDQFRSNQEKTKVGETVIDKAPRSTKKSNDSVGEYIDYEDVD